MALKYPALRRCSYWTNSIRDAFKRAVVLARIDSNRDFKASARNSRAMQFIADFSIEILTNSFLVNVADGCCKRSLGKSLRCHGTLQVQ
ncbi:hypothetical protein AGR7C_pAt0141 [Agrobacterium deltaense Zutra 3/1]|uniref:Uncharacterized protein n=1 Tax=Agrobacterium deltaense Zutra 3/1 TaxID=1183427 RepID=A0A1S7S3G3_9HYPH|nr:hypothetical protein AGR7C_pAt0141 [Agrobacterium deltaense Zutra 3/1]